MSIFVNNNANDNFFIWFDVEYSTLDLENANILQIAALITDLNLQRISSYNDDISLIIKLPKISNISLWVKNNLSELLKKCSSAEAINIVMADTILSKYIDNIIGNQIKINKRLPILAGNSIHADWRLIQKFLPEFKKKLNYRHLDVTSLKLEWNRLNSNKNINKHKKKFIKKYFPQAFLPINISIHDAYFDIQSSIAELAFYRKFLFKKNR